MNKITELDDLILQQRRTLEKTIKERNDLVKNGLTKEGLTIGTIYYDGTKKKIITDIFVKHDKVYIKLANLKKDGKTPSKYNINNISWKTILPFWRMQKDNQDLYVENLKERERQLTKEFHEACNRGELDDMF